MEKEKNINAAGAEYAYGSGRGMFSGIIKKADLVLGIVLIIICLASAFMVYGYSGSGSTVLVTVDGSEYGSYPLDKNAVIEIDTEFGHNQLTIQDGKAKITEADCPDQYCINQHKSAGGIDSENEAIICLPNKLVVSVNSDAASDSSADENVPDAVSGSPGA